MTDSNDTEPLKAGDHFGDYVVERTLGKGGMGAVYLVRSPGGSQYAVKVMFPGRITHDLRKRFAREAEFAMEIRHRNLIPVHDVGEDPETGLCYIIMDYMPGGTLSDRIKARGRLSVGDAALIIMQIAAALDVAHKNGIVHRDVKPDNILFAADGTPKLADLGVAKFNSDRRTMMTMTGMIIGTPAYMSPEQLMDSHHIDSRADIYSLGIVLYEMLAGERPNSNSTAVELLAKAVKGEPLPDIRDVRPDIPAAISHVLSLMCAPKPEDRPASSVVAAQLLHKAATGRLVLPKEPPKSPGKMALERKAKRKRAIAVSLAVAGAMVILSAGSIGLTYAFYRYLSRSSAQAESVAEKEPTVAKAPIAEKGPTVEKEPTAENGPAAEKEPAEPITSSPVTNEIVQIAAVTNIEETANAVAVTNVDEKAAAATNSVDIQQADAAVTKPLEEPARNSESAAAADRENAEAVPEPSVEPLAQNKAGKESDEREDARPFGKVPPTEPPVIAPARTQEVQRATNVQTNSIRRRVVWDEVDSSNACSVFNVLSPKGRVDLSREVTQLVSNIVVELNRETGGVLLKAMKGRVLQIALQTSKSTKRYGPATGKSPDILLYKVNRRNFTPLMRKELGASVIERLIHIAFSVAAPIGRARGNPIMSSEQKEECIFQRVAKRVYFRVFQEWPPYDRDKEELLAAVTRDPQMNQYDANGNPLRKPANKRLVYPAYRMAYAKMLWVMEELTRNYGDIMPGYFRVRHSEICAGRLTQPITLDDMAALFSVAARADLFKWFSEHGMKVSPGKTTIPLALSEPESANISTRARIVFPPVSIESNDWKTRAQWFYQIKAPQFVGDKEWTDADYPDAKWRKTRKAFGYDMPDAKLMSIADRWRTNNLWLRRHFKWEKASVAKVVFNVFYGGDVQIFLNGKMIREISSISAENVGWQPVAVSVSNFSSAVREGDNVLAVMVHDVNGRRYFDCGLTVWIYGDK